MSGLARPLSRRHVLAGAGLAVTCLGLPDPLCAQAGPTGFHVLRARSGTAALRGADQPPTPIWGYAETVPGPTLRVRRGDELRVRVFNDLPEPTTIHWHGVRLTNAMDGVPHLTQPAIAPGESFTCRFRAIDAGTFWYHPIVEGTEPAGRGLYGALIVGENERIEVDRDVVLIFDEWPLAADGAIAVAQAPGSGAHLTVNAAPTLDLPVRSNERLRLRLVNGARSRAFALRLDRHAAQVLAIDGQPAEPFLARDSRVTLGPGNRIDLFVDATLEPGARASVMVETAQGEVPLARLLYGREPLRAAPLAEPKPLPPNPLPERLDLKGALRQDLPLDTLARLPAALQEKRPLFTVRRGRTVVLALGNRADGARTVHVHGHHFRLLDRLDDGWKPFWLDTMVVAARQTERIAFLADNPGKWLIGGRALGDDGATAAWFEVQ